MLLSPLEREFFEGEHFVAGDPALFPLASDVLVQARAWIVSDATGDLASGYHTAEEPGAVPPVNPKRAPKAKRPTVAQLAQQQATLTTIVARLSEQLEQLQQQGAAHAGGFPPTGGAQVARGPMTGAVAPQVAAGQAQGLGAVAAQVATGQAHRLPQVRCEVLGQLPPPSFLGQAQVPEAGALHVSAGQVQSAGAGSGQNALGQVSGRGFLLQDARAAIREAPLSSHLPPFQSVPKSLASVLGPPPPARALLPRPEPETDKDALLASAISNGELPDVRPPEDLASAVLAQSRALAALAGHLSLNSDPVLDPQTTTGSRGSQSRQKLQAELAQMSGSFAAKVRERAAARMAPAGVALQEPVSLSRYYERFGGFATQREKGRWPVLSTFCPPTDRRPRPML